MFTNALQMAKASHSIEKLIKPFVCIPLYCIPIIHTLQRHYTIAENTEMKKMNFLIIYYTSEHIQECQNVIMSESMKECLLNVHQ